MNTSTLTTLQEINLDFVNHKNDEFEEAIIKTLAYFNIFDYPLTAQEIYNYLWSPHKSGFGQEETKRALENGIKKIAEQNGYYFLAGRQEIVELRKQRQAVAQEKYKKAQKIVKRLSVLPYIKMIAVCNSLAFNNAREDSDIDLFIITAKDKIWTARFYANTLLQFLGLRPEEDDKKDKICLNFFISEDRLNLESLTIDEDIYFVFWLNQLVPLYDERNFSDQLVAQNQWAGKFLNSGLTKLDTSRMVKISRRRRIIKRVNEKINKFKIIEKLLRVFQMKIMPQKIIDKMNQGTDVIITDEILKFHYDDRRKEFRDRFKEKIAQLVNGKN